MPTVRVGAKRGGGAESGGWVIRDDERTMENSGSTKKDRFERKDLSREASFFRERACKRARDGSKDT